MTRAKRNKRASAKPSFWESASLGNKIALISLVVTIIGLPLAYYLGYPSRAKDSRELQSLNAPPPSSSISPDPGCGFPAHFMRDTLYVLITRFEDKPTEGSEKPYGKGIEGRIDILSDRFKLPIRFCYRDDLPANQRRDANALREKFHADLVIWGKIKNASPECNSDGFCLQFEPSDTLITYAGGTVSKPKLDDYQFGVSGADVETELIRMGNEIFDDWLVGMFNLKIGKHMPELFAISDSWDTDKKANSYFARSQFLIALGKHKQAIEDIDKGLRLSNNKYARLSSLTSLS